MYSKTYFPGNDTSTLKIDDWIRQQTNGRFKQIVPTNFPAINQTRHMDVYTASYVDPARLSFFYNSHIENKANVF